ncbi:peptidoglycan DD-metalloendopeptidase family protein [Falsigemmobacter faecalis]|uniref:LysM peptidoglycan-binding domain-containing protein n=1 Tax=Falsigemmobacter faecalis TaxID=2488730 RepID=A0A3P3DUT8_9RHOB|nr:peptidoglycan DD-metalloendopeptidase family protein [Falsigemmobacter faecalis]RRH77939.1 LysM peptidoglycan-binding domain-containing protein [Falsigemmobacter faecalis]
MTLRSPRQASVLRGAVALSAVALMLSGCMPQNGQPMDWDLRPQQFGSTADAARSASMSRPQVDSRGIISYPGYQVVVARRGETVGTIASRLGVSADQMARTNAIQPDIMLQGGELLVLPGRVAESGGGPSWSQPMAPAQSGGSANIGAIATTALDRVPSGGGSTAQSSAPPRSTQVPFGTSGSTAGGVEPARHRVARGETAQAIARQYGVTTSALADWNGLNSSLTLREGQYLLIPPTATRSAAAAPAPAPVATAPMVNPPGQSSPTPQPPSANKPLPKENPTRAGGGNTGAAPASPVLPTTSSTASRLAMPADGKVIRAYQKGKYDGIGIGAAAGSPVRAAADGTVAAITRDTGQVPIVVIRHANNLLTVYANVDGLSVAKDATVRRGQTIGQVRAGNPAFLHFEVRRGADSVDPMSMLP